MIIDEQKNNELKPTIEPDEVLLFGRKIDYYY